ncbi:hypothetical protein Asppvi_010781 [Aspergillus pseudoviridinutans]|uniref:VOC domain-containing protein n=1 Tax=Aspergillus pseudoviridinutans TaxID=1517512 RepID=A0A9P3F097_9EURO|nr:uncharacterized protein Asppvi_010781 [Aspergillus pseudoviridinutans]GIJ91808.1 hypothetical protein Asppvi_010781 [Aspergillus pseudoviridinutans]
MPHLAHVSLVVRDYDEALAFYVDKLGFSLVEDNQEPNKRWVVIRPPGASPDATTILLARASTPEQLAVRDHDRFTENGVEWVRPPTTMSYGTVAVFKDLYGNQWDLIQRAKAS